MLLFLLRLLLLTNLLLHISFHLYDYIDSLIESRCYEKPRKKWAKNVTAEQYNIVLLKREYYVSVSSHRWKPDEHTVHACISTSMTEKQIKDVLPQVFTMPLHNRKVWKAFFGLSKVVTGIPVQYKSKMHVASH